MIPISWLLLSFLIAYLGRDTLIGFWGSFLISILLTPIVGALAVIITQKRRRSPA